MTVYQSGKHTLDANSLPVPLDDAAQVTDHFTSIPSAWNPWLPRAPRAAGWTSDIKPGPERPSAFTTQTAAQSSSGGAERSGPEGTARGEFFDFSKMQDDKADPLEAERTYDSDPLSGSDHDYKADDHIPQDGEEDGANGAERLSLLQGANARLRGDADTMISALKLDTYNEEGEGNTRDAFEMTNTEAASTGDSVVFQGGKAGSSATTPKRKRNRPDNATKKHRLDELRARLKRQSPLSDAETRKGFGMISWCGGTLNLLGLETVIDACNLRDVRTLTQLRELRANDNISDTERSQQEQNLALNLSFDAMSRYVQCEMDAFRLEGLDPPEHTFAMASQYVISDEEVQTLSSEKKEERYIAWLMRAYTDEDKRMQQGLLNKEEDRASVYGRGSEALKEFALYLERQSMLRSWGDQRSRRTS